MVSRTQPVLMNKNGLNRGVDLVGRMLRIWRYIPLASRPSAKQQLCR